MLIILKIENVKKIISGGIVVILDMSLALISIVTNLMVITSIREKESLMSKTFNLVLVNLCCSNLLNAVLVKSITIVHHAYAVTANVTQTDVAFCLLYKFSSRLSWAVLPWTIVVLAWMTLTPTFKRLLVFRTKKSETKETMLKSISDSLTLSSSANETL